MNELDRMLRENATPAEMKEAAAALDERERDKELQRRPYTNEGENHD